VLAASRTVYSDDGYGSQTATVTRPEAVAEVADGRVESEGGGGVGLVCEYQLLEPRDDLVIWNNEAIDGKAQHTGNDTAEIDQLQDTATTYDENTVT